MDVQPQLVSRTLRGCKQEISNAWERDVRETLPQLAQLSRAVLLDHMPEFLDALASWVDGDDTTARVGFETLAEGHALQRLELFEVDLATLTREYALLRSAILRQLRRVVPTVESIRDDLVRLNEGMDLAIYEAVRRYTARRDQARDRFIGILAHDLRNPLDAIAMAARLIRTEASDPHSKLHALGETIDRSSGRMARMVTDLVELARGQLGGRFPVELAASDLGEIAKRAVDELGLAHPDRRLVYAGHGDLRGFFDRDRVMQAVSNLVANAVSYGRDPIEVTVREADDRHTLVLSVANAGPPIAADRIAHLFDPQRIETPGTRRGLGLGLYIVRQIALAHGARCEVRSDDGHTVFTIVWPRTPVDEVPSRT